MAMEKVSFEGAGGAELAARLDLPEGPHLATALFAHCFTCGKDITAARRIAGRLAAAGIAVLRFDFTGLGHSGVSSRTPRSPRMSAIWWRRRTTWPRATWHPGF